MAFKVTPDYFNNKLNLKKGDLVKLLYTNMRKQHGPGIIIEVYKNEQELRDALEEDTQQRGLPKASFESLFDCAYKGYFPQSESLLYLCFWEIVGI